MSRIDPTVWMRLAGGAAQGEGLWARRAAPEVTDRLVAALDADGQRHLLVLLSASEVDLQDAQSRGVAVVTRELAMPGHQTGRYLDIVCHDAVGHEIFDFIGGEVAERLSGPDAAPDIVKRVLAKWRRFWGQSPIPIISREEQLGLFAELWFLGVWMIPKVGASEAIKRWRGPYGSRHDFEWPGSSVEVKATTSTRGRIHRIHGLEQLALPEQGKLLLFSLRLREEGGATNTLPSAITTCRAALESNTEALDCFENALAKTGYSPAHDNEYAKMCLRVIEEGLFRVDEDFPRLTSASFPGGVPSGVERVEYEVNLTGRDHLLVAANPAAVVAI